MSRELLWTAREYARGEVRAQDFSGRFIAAWKRERDNGALVADDPALSLALSDIFCAADNYDPDSDRGCEEFDDAALLNEVRKILARLDAASDGPVRYE